MTSKLTANIGLRWDYFGFPADSDGGWRSSAAGYPFDTLRDGRQLPTLIPAPTPRISTSTKGIIGTSCRGWAWRIGAPTMGGPQRFRLVRQCAAVEQLYDSEPAPPTSGTFGSTRLRAAQIIDLSTTRGSLHDPNPSVPRRAAQILTLDNAFPGQGTAAARTNLI